VHLTLLAPPETVTTLLPENCEDEDERLCRMVLFLTFVEEEEQRGTLTTPVVAIEAIAVLHKLSLSL
jgi:hypothetical protein